MHKCHGLFYGIDDQQYAASERIGFPQRTEVNVSGTRPKVAAVFVVIKALTVVSRRALHAVEEDKS